MGVGITPNKYRVFSTPGKPIYVRPFMGAGCFTHVFRTSRSSPFYDVNAAFSAFLGVLFFTKNSRWWFQVLFIFTRTRGDDPI